MAREEITREASFSISLPMKRDMSTIAKVYQTYKQRKLAERRGSLRGKYQRRREELKEQKEEHEKKGRRETLNSLLSLKTWSISA